MKKSANLAILFIAYPIFYWLDRHVVPSHNIFWHSYAQDIVMPGLILLWTIFNGELLFSCIRIRIVMVIGALEFLFGVYYEYRQSIGTIPGTADLWDILCYALGILIAISVLLFMNNEREKV